MDSSRLSQEAVLKIGEVTGVSGRRISVTVDREKNLSELFFDGYLVKNVAVGSYVDIRKGYLSLIGKVEGENVQFDTKKEQDAISAPSTKRELSVSLVGYLDGTGNFKGGTKELPLVGNETFLLTKPKVQAIHRLSQDDNFALKIAKSDAEGYDIGLPIDGLMNSHIAIFGNTGSGKSNTLANLFQSFIASAKSRNAAKFESDCRILILDFNGEYTARECISEDKTVYALSTETEAGGTKIPVGQDELLNIEMLSILADATEKTQKPFLKRALTLMSKVKSADNPLGYALAILRNQSSDLLKMSDKIRADLVLRYLGQILPEETDPQGLSIALDQDIEWHNSVSAYKRRGTADQFFQQRPELIANTVLARRVENYSFADDPIADFISFMYIQLIDDLMANRAQNEHISPVINKLKGKQKDIQKVFVSDANDTLFRTNIVVLALNKVNLEMRKTIPLLVCKKIYDEQKKGHLGQTLHLVVDEAHNILSRESFRESEGWKDYRLETFEEVIKEGRKFGVFVTISSQRPNDISQTITSQAHNYFIHRLINERDLAAISSAVSYIDRITEESIPTLPTGVCIFSGVAGQMPIKLAIDELPKSQQPKSQTIEFKNILLPPEG